MVARGKFSSKLGFILAASGSAVGLGNIWRFPYEVGLGGGAAFLFMYLFFCFILCFPVMVTEIAIGRKAQKNAAGAFEVLGLPKWKFLGILGIACGVLILSFYNVIAGWAFGYFFEMASGNFEISQNFGGYTSDITKVGLYSLVFIFTTAFVVSKGISGGIEKLAKFLMPTLIVMILIISFYGMTLENAFAGYEFYLVPDFSKFDSATIGGALRQAFFSLSLGMGALITYGSYLPKEDNILSSSAIITLMDVGIAFLAGLMIFPLVAYNNLGDMSTVSADQAGPGLIFITLPNVFASLGSYGAVIGAAFFLLLTFAALTSTVSLLEVPVAYAVDEFNFNRKKATLYVSSFIFLIGIPSLLSGGYSKLFSEGMKLPGMKDGDFITTLTGFTDSFLLLGGFLLVTFSAYVWKKKNLFEEISIGFPAFKRSWVIGIFNFALVYISPTVLFLLFLLVVLNNFFGISFL